MKKLALPALMSLLLLTACGGSEEPQGYEYAPPTNVPAEPTPAGTTLALGEGALLPVTEDGTTAEPAALLPFTVVDIVKGEASFWDEYENADEFAGQVPWFIVTAMDSPELITLDQSDIRTAAVVGIDASGKPLDGVGLEGLGSTGLRCPLELDMGSEPHQAMSCKVAVAPEGTEVAGAQWDSVPDYIMTAPTAEENPYVDQPVVWQK